MPGEFESPGMFCFEYAAGYGPKAGKSSTHDDGHEYGERNGFNCGNGDVHCDRVCASVAVRDLNHKTVRANIVNGGRIGNDLGRARAAGRSRAMTSRAVNAPGDGVAVCVSRIERQAG